MTQQEFFGKFTTWALRWRVPLLLFFLSMAVVSMCLLPKLRFDFSPEAMLEFSDEEKAYNEAFIEKFSGNDNTFLVVLHAEESLLTSSSMEDLRSLTDVLEGETGVDSVYSLTRVPDNDVSMQALLQGGLKPIVSGEEITPEMMERLGKRIETSDLVDGNLISADRKFALIMLTINEKYSSQEAFFDVLQSIEATIEAWKSKQDRQEYTIVYGGLPYIRALTVDTMKTEQIVLWPVVGVIYLIALIVACHNFFQALFPLLSVGVVVLLAIAAMVLMDEPVTMINNTMPLLILIVGVTNGIYVLQRILDERRAGLAVKEAVTSGVSKIAIATFLTTLTTAIGFGSLVVAKSHILNSFGLIIAMSIMLIYVTIIIMMPLLVSYLKLIPKKQANGDEKNGKGYYTRFFQKLGEFTTSHSKTIFVCAIVALGLLVYAGSYVPFDSKVNDVFESDHEVSRANKIIEEKLGGILPLNVDITADENYFRSIANLRKISELQDKIKRIDGVLMTISARDILREAQVDFSTTSQVGFELALAGILRMQPEQYYNYVTPDMSNVNLSVRLPDAGVKKTKAVIHQIDELCQQTFSEMPGVEYRLTGTAYNCAFGLDSFTKDLAYSLATAFIIIFIVLIIAFKSFWVGAAAVLPNLLSIALTLSCMLLYDYELNTTSVLVFTISIGLSVDNSIHIISRFRQEYSDSDSSVRGAVIKALCSSGRAILKSNFLLIIGLSALLFSSFEPIARVGVLTMTTIASALVISLFVIPAEIMILGKRMSGKKNGNHVEHVSVEIERAAIPSKVIE